MPRIVDKIPYILFTKYSHPRCLLVQPIKRVDKALYQTAYHLCMSIAARHEQGRPSCYFGGVRLKFTKQKIVIKPRITILRRCGIFNALYQKQSDENDSHKIKKTGARNGYCNPISMFSTSSKFRGFPLLFTTTYVVFTL